MFTHPRTGVRSIRPARETFAAVALIGLTLATGLRGLDGRPGGVAGAILTLLALAVLSRYRVAWDEDGLTYQTPFSCRHRRWAELSAYTLEPRERERSAAADAPRPRGLTALLQPCRLRLHGRRSEISINLKPYSWQDIRHVTDRVSHEIPLCEPEAVAVS